MKIIKIEKNEIDIELTKIHIEHNGMDAYYYLGESLFIQFQEELNDFKKMFFDNGEIDYGDVMSDEDIFNYFGETAFIKNEKVDKEREKLFQEEINCEVK